VEATKGAYLETEPIGLRQLDALGREVYGEAVPDGVLWETHTIRFAKEDGKPVLVFTVPGLDRSSLDVTRKGSELLIDTGSHSRVFALPDTLATSEIHEARYRDGELVITFASGE
jgi:HSP20 family molecular chaperone IbpA